MRQSESINELALAMSKAQGQFFAPKLNKINPHFKSRYADLDSVWAVCRDPLEKNGLSIFQGADVISGQLFLITRIAHSSGQWIESSFPMYLSKNTPQEIGSWTTYLGRYALTRMLGINGDEDDDGNSESLPEKKEALSMPSVVLPTNEQVKTMEALLTNHTELWDPINKKLKALKVDSISKMPLEEFLRARNYLNGEIAKKDQVAA